MVNSVPWTNAKVAYRSGRLHREINNLVDRDCELAVNLVILNKAKQHTDTHMHTYTDTDIVIILLCVTKIKSKIYLNNAT